MLCEAGQGLETTVHHAGTYVCMEGPAFSSLAESKMHQLWGGDLIGMTCLPEAKLAREAEMCYALLALPTDYDCWRAHEPGKTRQALLAEIIANLQAASAHAIALLGRAVPAVARQMHEPCPCRDALALAIWSDKSKIAPADAERLRPIVGRYLGMA